MLFFCDDCKYIDDCKPHKDNPQSIGCSDFGLYDEDGLIEDWDMAKKGKRMTNKQAIDRLNELLLCTSLLSDTDHEAMRKGIKALENKRPQGEWKEIFTSTVHMYTEYECSVCGRLIQNYEGKSRLLEVYPYCHCGADMRGNN